MESVSAIAPLAGLPGPTPADAPAPASAQAPSSGMAGLEFARLLEMPDGTSVPDLPDAQSPPEAEAENPAEAPAHDDAPARGEALPDGPEGEPAEEQEAPGAEPDEAVRLLATPATPLAPPQFETAAPPPNAPPEAPRPGRRIAHSVPAAPLAEPSSPRPARAPDDARAATAPMVPPGAATLRAGVPPLQDRPARAPQPGRPEPALPAAQAAPPADPPGAGPAPGGLPRAAGFPPDLPPSAATSAIQATMRARHAEAPPAASVPELPGQASGAARRGRHAGLVRPPEPAVPSNPGAGTPARVPPAPSADAVKATPAGANPTLPAGANRAQAPAAPHALPVLRTAEPGASVFGPAEGVEGAAFRLAEPAHAAQPPAHSGAATLRADAARLPLPQAAEILARHPDRPVEITLRPEELGHVRMALSTADSGISLTITAERPETLDLMRRHIEQLAAEFRRLGFDDLGFQFRQGGTGPGGDRPPPGPRTPESAAQTGGADPDRQDPALPTPRPVSAGLDLRL